MPVSNTRDQFHDAIAGSGQFVVSATRIETFELCKRKYWFRESQNLSSGSSTSLAFGTVLHAVAERFLKADDLGRDAHGNPVDLYPQGWDAGLTPGEALLIRRLIAKGIEEGTLERLNGRKIEHEFTEPLGDGILLHGTIDYLLPDGVQDHKTAKNARYAKSPAKLQKNTQLLIYGYQVAKNTSLQNIKLRHNVFLKEEIKTKKVETSVPRQAILDNWERIKPIAADMKRLSVIPLARWTEIPAAEDQVSACQAYGGCPYRTICGGRETPEHYATRTNRIEKEMLGLQSIGAPAPKSPAPPAAPAAAINPPAAPVAPEPKYWVTNPQTRAVFPEQKTRADVVALLPTLGDMPVMLVGGTEWKKASEQGIVAAPAPAAPAAPAGPAPPWAVPGCPSCVGSGWNSKGNPCRICDAERAKTNGPQSAHFDIATTEAGIAWTAKAVTQTVATPPTAPVTLSPELAAFQAGILARLDTPKGSTPPAAPTPPAPDASGNPDPAPKRRGRRTNAEIAAAALAGVQGTTTNAANGTVQFHAPAPPAAPAGNVGFMLLVGCGPEKGVPLVVSLEDEFADAGAELAKASGKESYYDLPAFDRRDALAKHAKEIASDWNGAAVTVRTDTPDIKALVAALRPLATVVIGGFGN